MRFCPGFARNVSIFTGREADRIAKNAAEVCLMGEAAVDRNCAKCLARPNAFASVSDSALADKIANAAMIVLPKHPCDVRWMTSRVASDLAQA